MPIVISGTGNIWARTVYCREIISCSNLLISDVYSTVPYPLSDAANPVLNTTNKTIIGAINECLGAIVAEDLWDRTGTTLTTHFALDKVQIDNALIVNSSIIVSNNNAIYNNNLERGAVQFRNLAQTVDCCALLTGTISNYWLICEFADSNYNFGHASPVDPTFFLHSHNQSQTEYVGIQHDSNNFLKLIGSGSEISNHITPLDMADDGTFNLPTSSAGFCFMIVGDSEEYAHFVWDSSGNVDMIASSANVVTTDTDTKFCLITGADPVVIKNRLGSAKKIVFNYHYHTP